jgi:hypothetical protein
MRYGVFACGVSVVVVAAWKDSEMADKVTIINILVIPNKVWPLVAVQVT